MSIESPKPNRPKLRWYHWLLFAGVILFGALQHDSGRIAPLFTASVQHWGRDITRWADEWDLDPNLVATVMQIESCGHPDVTSSAGAEGLFQVMPFLFADDEQDRATMIDPETNAKRGLWDLHRCVRNAKGTVPQALACYNAGTGNMKADPRVWVNETLRYVVWGQGIYQDAQNGASHSNILDWWYTKAGANLCRRAETYLNNTGG